MWLEEHLKKFKRILLMVSHSQVDAGQEYDRLSPRTFGFFVLTPLSHE